jgi:hypothetical protein
MGGEGVDMGGHIYPSHQGQLTVENPVEFLSLFSHHRLNKALQQLEAEFCFKGTVQRKLTWFKSGINRQLMVSSCSDGHFFKFKGPSRFKKCKRVFSI